MFVTCIGATRCDMHRGMTRACAGTVCGLQTFLAWVLQTHNTRVTTDGITRNKHIGACGCSDGS